MHRFKSKGGGVSKEVCCIPKGVQGLKFLRGTAPAGHTPPSPQPFESARYPQDLKSNAHEN